jgi:DnaD/phage-associated family protein
VFTEAYAGVNSSYGYVDGPVKRNAAGTVTCVEADTPEKEPMAPKAPEPAPARKAEPRPVYSPEQISGLAGDEDFSQLLYIAQKYMNKVFTQRECEVFAYLYDGLHMTAELLEYVVEYCVQGGHTSIRYIETVAINWHESGLKTVEDAKAYASSFTRDSFAVMKAFGLNDRKPGDSEREMIDRWFKTYGFTRELVLEACNRTLAATHSPSFKYADKILSGWKKAGVRSLEDIRRLDEQHAERAKGKGSGNGSGSQDYRGGGNGRGRSTNQFQNFPQREIDYDALVLQQLTEK